MQTMGATCATLIGQATGEWVWACLQGGVGEGELSVRHAVPLPWTTQATHSHREGTNGLIDQEGVTYVHVTCMWQACDKHVTCM